MPYFREHMNRTLRIVTIVGARPQFVKAAMVSRAIAEHNRTKAYPAFTECILHTGQHYDRELSHVFFEELGIPEPTVNLAVGSGNHGETTGAMLAGIERELMQRKPDWMLVYGDTNSTLAGALAAAKLHVPVAHVEAGLRSFNRAMPEEINRVLTDHLSTRLLCPTPTAVDNLTREGISEGVHHVGDVMYDAALFFGALAEEKSNVLERTELDPRGYCLATVHRAENTDDPKRLERILCGLNQVGQDLAPVVLPLHPRTHARLRDRGIIGDGEGVGVTSRDHEGIRFIPPQPFLAMVMLEKNARVILTDSGGVQKEAYFHGVPCVTLRDETEWVETVECDWNQIVGADVERIVDAACTAAPSGRVIAAYGNGDAAPRVIERLSDPAESNALD